MNTQCIGNRVERLSGFVPADLDPEAVKILREAGFLWDFETFAFQRARPDGSGRTPTARIEYRFLREQRLIINGNLGKIERVGQLQRLRILVQSVD